MKRFVGPVLLLLAAAPLGAIQPASWVHTTEADFADGEFVDTVVTNHGDIKLSAATQVLAEIDDQTSIVYDIQSVGDEPTLYIAGGPQARLLRHAGDAVEPVAELPGEQIFTLDAYDGKLLLGISGAISRLAVLEGDEIVTLIELPAVRYVWDMVVVGKTIYLATGTEGQLLKVDMAVPADAPAPPPEDEAAVAPELAPEDEPELAPEDEAADAPEQAPEDVAAEEAAPAADPRITILLDAAQDNLLCLGRDDTGRLYTGSDTDGLIYRITEAEAGQPDVFVLYDAPEPEIGALLVLADGTIYAGTADAAQARPGRLEAPAKSETGRPEPKAPAAPDQVQPPAPDPAEMPVEMPAEPAADAAESEPEAPDSPAEPEPAAAAEEPPAETDKPNAEADAEASADQSGKPTTEQYDQLRAAVKERLMAARQGQPMQAAPAAAPRSQSAPAPTRAPQRRPGRKAKTKPGNAIYRISPDHFVTEVFRESVMILNLAEIDGRLLVATGNDGQIFSVDPQADETNIIVDLDSQQVPIAVAGDGHVLLGTANPASLVRLDESFAQVGTYTSPVLDADHVSKWGVAHLTGRIAEGASVTVEVRAGNVEDSEHAAWADWSAPIEIARQGGQFTLQPVEFPLVAPSARFLQYRLTFKTTGPATPVIDKIQIAYVLPNRRPTIESIEAKYPGKPGQPQRGGSGEKGEENEPKHESKLNITWKAADPNNDPLQYTLEYRPAGVELWLPLKDNLTAAKHTWQTQRVPDGWYQLRLTASDAPGNTPDMAAQAQRRSDPVLIDNTPPTIAQPIDMQIEPGRVRMQFKAADPLAGIAAVHWTADAAGQWQPALPDDLIYDSTNEQIAVTIPDLEPGPHVVTLRVTDTRGNALYHAQVVQVNN